MPDHLRIYIKYEVLYFAEYRAVVGDLERAYNKIESFLKESSRVRRRQRLKIFHVETGKSIETILIGTALTLRGLSYVINKVLETRKRGWNSEEAKWKAKLAKQEYQDKERRESDRLVHDALVAENPNLTDASQILETRIGRIERSRNIISVELEFGSDDESRRR